MRLTGKQELFCQEYLVDLNARQAAIRAGYSKRTAGEMGYENLNKPHIASRLATLMAKRTERVQYTADDLLSDMIDVLAIAKKMSEKEDASPSDVSAFKGMAEVVGKHVEVQGFSEKQVVEHTGNISHDTTAIGNDVLAALFERRRDEQERSKSVH